MASSLVTTFTQLWGNNVLSVLKESKFKEKGIITPQEFMAAGEYLVHHCPTWQWSTPADKKRLVNYLDTDKQFLITRNVPCSKRCHQMDYDPQQEMLIDTEGDDEGWVDTHHYAPETSTATKDMEETPIVPDDDSDDEGEALDMEAAMEDLDIEDDDPNEAPAPVVHTSSEEGSNIVQTRTYDLNITYDNYYKVPRFWLVGYNEKRRLLSVNEMYEDFSADHAKKTVTMESHPFIPGPNMASIHPCRHAAVMLRLIEQLAESGKEMDVTQYLLIFLKFVQAVIPTIEYDFTRNVNIG